MAGSSPSLSGKDDADACPVHAVNKANAFGITEGDKKRIVKGSLKGLIYSISYVMLKLHCPRSLSKKILEPQWADLPVPPHLRRVFDLEETIMV